MEHIIKVLNLSKKAPNDLQPPANWREKQYGSEYETKHKNPVVDNCRALNSKDVYVYIGRANSRMRLKGSVFANPFTIEGFRHKVTRENIIEAYRQYFLSRYNGEPNFRDEVLDLADISKRGNLYLICWCVNETINENGCHGGVIKEIVGQIITGGIERR